jgi:hypothetical protein
MTLDSSSAGLVDVSGSRPICGKIKKKLNTHKTGERATKDGPGNNTSDTPNGLPAFRPRKEGLEALNAHVAFVG